MAKINTKKSYYGRNKEEFKECARNRFYTKMVKQNLKHIMNITKKGYKNKQKIVKEIVLKKEKTKKEYRRNRY